MRLVAGVVAALVQSSLIAQDPDPETIIKKVEAAYAALESYEAHGEVVSNSIMGDTSHRTVRSFSLRLMKPGLFRFTWNDRAEANAVGVNGGAAWVDKGEAFFYMRATNNISEMASGRMALAAATGVSFGAANTIPSLFLNDFGGGTIFTGGEQLKLTGEEQLGKEICYVLTGPSIMTKELTVWVGKGDFLIRKISRSLERDAGQKPIDFPEITDEMIENTLRATGQKVSAEWIRRTRADLKEGLRRIASSQLKGSIVETHLEISFPELTAVDFVFLPPQGGSLEQVALWRAWGRSIRNGLAGTRLLRLADWETSVLE